MRAGWTWGSFMVGGPMLAALLGSCREPEPEAPPADTTGVALGPLDGPTDAAVTEPVADDTRGMVLDVGSMFDLFTSETSDSEDCDGLEATVRDFEASHPDFETYTGNMAFTGLVMPTLGADRKPQLDPSYAGPPMITSEQSFSAWYEDVPGTNMAFPIALELVDEGNGEFSFDSDAFFPLDDMGFGNEGNEHNFHFTTEVHTSFTYEGGEVFTFRGDDDLWMFVDGRLAIDLGGLHPALESEVDMDSLGLEAGQTYPMDIFHAERHTTQSNFRIVTTIECFVTPPPPA